MSTDTTLPPLPPAPEGFVMKGHWFNPNSGTLTILWEETGNSRHERSKAMEVAK